MGQSRRERFEAEVLPHIDDLFGYAVHLCRNRDDAADLVQETYERALKASEQYTLGTNARAWLFAILRNTFLNQRRARSRRPESMGGTWIEEMARMDVAELHKVGPDPGVRMLDDLRARDIQEALETLPEDFRDAVVLCDVQGFKYAEIASILDIPIGTVRSRIHRGRIILRNLLAGWREGRASEEGT